MGVETTVETKTKGAAVESVAARLLAKIKKGKKPDEKSPSVKACVAELQQDFERRRRERLPFELQWRLNTNFLIGNQYCDINTAAERLYEIERAYDWQEREVFNHIAPIVETRLAKLSRVQPAMSVRPATEDIPDVAAAKICTKILKAAARKVHMEKLISEATHWSEVCGTSFYKSTWSSDGLGDITCTVCPPYEIFPDSNYASGIAACRSIIHARAYAVDEVEQMFGVKLQGGDIDVYTLRQVPSSLGGLGYASTVSAAASGMKSDSVIVLERYDRPDTRHPDGRLRILAGETLVYDGPLPYRNGDGGTVDLPFARQVAISHAGCFWGTSVIERCIPIQRAYNAVKNRKHECLNRAAVGVLCVEDGAVDVEELQMEGLTPGKVLTYRQGGQPPRLLEVPHVPGDLIQEEERLGQEFVLISGVSEFSRYSMAPDNVTSGIALEMIREQDESRLALANESIEQAVLAMTRQWLRLYKQYATRKRMDRLVGDASRVLTLAWDGRDITSDDVAFDTGNAISDSPVQRRALVFDLLNSGLLQEPDTGRIDRAMRAKILEMLQMGNWEASGDMDARQIQRAQKENGECESVPPVLLDYDDDELHLREHVSYLLSSEYDLLRARKPVAADVLEKHAAMHRQRLEGKTAEEARLHGEAE